MSTQDLVARLRQALDSNDNVLLAYLFGSRAKGGSGPLSDYDVAVLLRDDSPSSLAEVLFSVSSALKVSEDKVDILDLARSPLSLKARVISEGVKIIDRGYEDELRLEVNVNYPELAYYTDRLLKAWLRNPRGLDLRVVKDGLDYLSELHDYLEVFLRERSVEAVSSSFEAWHALKSLVQDSVQAMIDVCAHVFSSKNLGVAESYRDYVEKLAERGYMDEELARELKLAIALRNRLIHRYLAVEPGELWSFASKLATTVIPRFREWAFEVARGFMEE